MHNIDVIWFHLVNMKNVAGLKPLRSRHLFKVSQLVLILPKRVFSMVRKNKTDQRGSLSNETLSNMLSLKLFYPDRKEKGNEFFKFNPSDK